ncbi:MAG: hypothetical protein ACK56I_29195, partial [bacterium]
MEDAGKNRPGRGEGPTLDETPVPQQRQNPVEGRGNRAGLCGKFAFDPLDVAADAVGVVRVAHPLAQVRVAGDGLVRRSTR